MPRRGKPERGDWMDQNQFSEKKVEQLLSMASKKLGVSPDQLKSQLQQEMCIRDSHPYVGEARVRCEAGGDPFQIIVGFADRGRPYNPLDRQDPDVTLDAQRRQIGGLGIFMAKKLMDDIQYEYRDGKNLSLIHISPAQHR